MKCGLNLLIVIESSFQLLVGFDFQTLLITATEINTDGLKNEEYLENRDRKEECCFKLRPPCVHVLLLGPDQDSISWLSSRDHGQTETLTWV